MSLTSIRRFLNFSLLSFHFLDFKHAWRPRRRQPRFPRCPHFFIFSVEFLRVSAGTNVICSDIRVRRVFSLSFILVLLNFDLRLAAPSLLASFFASSPVLYVIVIF
jgi:hypothetical protein